MWRFLVPSLTIIIPDTNGASAPMRRHTDATRRCLKAIFTFVLVTFPWALPADSLAVMKGLTVEDLTGRSDLVLSGQVESVTAGWSDDGKTISTTAIVVVSEVIKGRSALRKIAVEYPGGEVGDIGLRVSDEPGMEKGEKVLLFLKQGDNGHGATHKFNLVGKGQGKYSIGSDGMARKKGFSIVGEKSRIDAEIPLDALLEKIRRGK